MEINFAFFRVSSLGGPDFARPGTRKADPPPPGGRTGLLETNPRPDLGMLVLVGAVALVRVLQVVGMAAVLMHVTVVVIRAVLVTVLMTMLVLVGVHMHMLMGVGGPVLMGMLVHMAVLVLVGMVVNRLVQAMLVAMTVHPLVGGAASAVLTHM